MFHNAGMHRVDRKQLLDVIMARISREPKVVRRRWAEGFYYSYSEEVLAHLVHEVLDEIFKNDGVLVRPDPIYEHRATVHGSSTPAREAGKWGVTEPWPDVFGPMPIAAVNAAPGGAHDA